MANERDNQCAHEGCSCAVREGQSYCSAYCERAETQRAEEGGSCDCGHPDCRQ